MNMSIFISLLFGLQFFYWLVGRRSSKNLSTKEDYFLAGKTVSLFPLMMTFLATQVGGGLFLGAADEAYHFGWPVLLYPLGQSLGFILLGLSLGKKLAGMHVSTVAQIFETVYRSTVLRKVASLLSVVSLFMILIAQIIASNKFLVSLGLNSTPLFIIFWTIVILYTVQGGLKAVISTDIVQATFFSMVFLACFGFVLYIDPIASTLPLPQLESFALVSSKFSGWLLMPLLFMVVEQDMGQRCFAGASPRIVSKAALWAGIATMIVCVVPVFFGCLANALDVAAPKGGSILMTVITKTTNPWITAFVGCAILAAIISTATSLINAISSNLSSDFKLTLLKRFDTMALVKTITTLIAIGALFSAFYFSSIIDILIQSYELSVSCLLVSILIALFKKQGNVLSASLSIFFGALGFVLFRFYPIILPKEIASIVLSLGGYSCGELISYCKTKFLEKAS